MFARERRPPSGTLSVERTPTICGTALVLRLSQCDAPAMAIVFHRKLDLQGQTSALAVAHAASALRELAHGELMEVLASDPGSVTAFASWSRGTGNALLESSQLGNVFRFVIRKV